MRVLVDTSVWSLALRRRAVPADIKVELLSELVASGQTIFLTGIILQEILQGVKDKSHLTKLERYFEPFALIEPNRRTYIHGAHLYSLCRAKGTPVATVDCLIASVALSHECKLLARDTDFEKLAAVSELELL